MSILGGSALAILFTDAMLVILVIGVPLAILLRVFFTGSVIGPQRLDPRRPAFPLLIAMMLGFCGYLLVPSGYQLWVNHQTQTTSTAGSTTSADTMPTTSSTTAPTTSPTTEPTTAPSSQPPMGAVDAAFMYSAPALTMLGLLLLADWMIGGAALIRRLGLDPRRIRSGVFLGILMTVAILPLANVVLNLANVIYKYVNYNHPQEHELLKQMGESQSHPIARLIMIASATLIAPVAEEVFFRGHLQTLIQRGLILLSRPNSMQGAAVFGFPVNQGTPSIESAPAPASAIPLASEFRPVWQTWVAILVTSAIFASLHGWMWPGIFVLSLGLGYVYERTGSLWSNITLHLLFNSISTASFLMSAHA